MKKILVVDDEQDIREIIKISLEEDGFRVLEANNGKDAIELAKSEKPNLITLDILMPNMDGFQIAKILKEDPVTADIPIIILSVLSEDKKQFMQGITDYISKPFKPNELVSKIKEAIEKTGLDEKSKNILVVDDDPDVIDIISLSLKDKGFTLISANNGVEALEKLKIFIPNLIILDIHMPKMNGYELIKHLKKEPKLNSIPIIVLTGTYISKKDIEHGLTLGATKYLTKPFTIDTLIKEIEELLCQN
ncbi:MAG: response regulator [Candidatus Omnitrophota bacterium]